MNSSQQNFKNILLKAGRSLWKIGHNPDTDWVLIFCVSCIVAIAYAGWAITLYEGVGSGSFFITPDVQPEERKTLNTKTLKEVSTYFESTKAQPLPTITASDPSL